MTAEHAKYAVKELKSNSAVKLSVFGGKVVFEGRNLSARGEKAVMKGILVPAGNVKKNSTGVAKFEIIS